jgi:putative ABC transport system permease protein
MLKNYLKITLRTLWKDKGFSFINVSGLAIGISTCILISLYVLDELSYDTFHKNARNIYRLTELLHLPKEVRPQAVTSPPMAHALQQNFPEVKKTVRFTQSSRLLTYQDKKFFDTQIWYADSSLFELFSFPMIKGEPQSALIDPYSIVLTEKAAKKYFGDSDPLGKAMSLSDTIPLTVTGVVKDIPSNSHIQFDVLLSFSTIVATNNNQQNDNWFNNGYYTYALLEDGTDYKNLATRYGEHLKKLMGKATEESGLWYEFVFQPLSDIHLRSTAPYDMGPNGNIKYVYIFSIVAALVLLIACANYINLSTARAMNRAKELGIRKVIGAKRKQIVQQLLGESFLVTFISFVIGVAIVTAALPKFNTITNKSMDARFLFTPAVISSALTIFLLIVMLAGGYPAVLMASFSPIRTLTNYVRQGRESGLIRKGLVVFQFTMSIILIAGTIIIFRQMDFLQNKNLGLDKEQILQLRMRDNINPKYQLIKEEMSKVPSVIIATATNFSYGNGISNIAMLPEGAADNEITSEAVFGVDHNFIPTFKIELVAGRNFSKDIPTDEADAFIVNESAVKHFNWGTPETALGKKIDWGLGKKGKVIGVVKDFNYTSLHETIQPLIIHIIPNWFNLITLKVNADNIPETIEQLEEKWNALNLDSPFDYSFLDADFEKLYRAEQQTQSIVGFLASLAIFIACLGLFGLAAFMAEQRTKEIGVRKVLGADVLGIIALLSKDFLVLVGIAIVIALPISWFVSTKWLDSFAYRTDLTWWIFAIAGVIAILISLLTVSFQSVKAAMANPVNSLRNE